MAFQIIGILSWQWQAAFDYCRQKPWLRVSSFERSLPTWLLRLADTRFQFLWLLLSSGLSLRTFRSQ
eukprot:1618178-Amphidinium_carterae.1